MDALPWGLLGCSVMANIALAIGMRLLKRRKKLDITAQDLLHDFTRRGASILRVEIIDPSSLMLRSPRL